MQRRDMGPERCICVIYPQFAKTSSDMLLMKGYLIGNYS